MKSIAPARRSRWLPPLDVLSAVVFVIAHAALLFLWPAVLAQDAPQWIAEGAVLNPSFRARLASGCQLAPALPPNAISQAVISLLCFVISPELAGRVYIVAW